MEESWAGIMSLLLVKSLKFVEKLTWPWKSFFRKYTLHLCHFSSWLEVSGLLDTLHKYLLYLTVQFLECILERFPFFCNFNSWFLRKTLFSVKCSQNSTSLVPPSPTYSAHRGAARQMFGSGSLRSPGSKPIYATGQRQHGVRSTVSPQHSRKHLIPVIKYPAFPLPIPAEDFHRISGGGE